MRKNSCLLVVSLLMFGAGFLLTKNEWATSIMIPYLLLGFGVGLFGNSISGLLVARNLKSDPELAKKDRINSQDERNQFISAKSKEKAFDLTTYLLGALMLAYALMKQHLAVELSLVAVYLLIHFYASYWRFRLEKEI